MEVMPSEYQHVDLSRNEKVFVRHIMSNGSYGYLLINVNPAMLSNESMHILIMADGIMMFKFFDGFEDATQFNMTMSFYASSVHKQTIDIIVSKLKTNKELVDKQALLKFPVSIIYVFSALSRRSVDEAADASMKSFVEDSCLFKEDLSILRTNLAGLAANYLSHPIAQCSAEQIHIDNGNLNSILQRIAPEYVTIRVATVIDEKTRAGADNELIVVTENDAAVRAFRLDDEQINIVNKINKGDQLILACAGSGKSVLLIAKCFKAAAMNPDKQFLITCYNKNLHSLYTWFIDVAGLRAKNVTCLTFHTLCRSLLQHNGFIMSHSDFDGWVDNAILRLNAGQIKERYYGIFIDEVQEFNTEWYKFCFNLLENKKVDDHLFVICGDKTQKLKSQQKHGKAPWNAGEGYPSYRGGNKNIRIERNYRNCIEINEYINRYVSYAKEYLRLIDKDSELDPDMFLRGKSVFHGYGVTIKHLAEHSNRAEARAVYNSIVYIHDTLGIPYDEIAVVMFNSSYRKKISGWNDKKYNLETSLAALLAQDDIPVCRMYDSDVDWGARYGEDGGVRFIKFASVLGLDFRAAIVCGLMPFGDYNETKNPNWTGIKNDEEKFQKRLQFAQNDIRYLYVACTRAKEVLHIILPETSKDSVYVKMLEDAE